MRLEPGARLGAYDVTGILGAGGMGEVYRARDTRLGRDVAIKILPDLFTSDSQRLARFEREARVLASLNHPNIASIHGLEDFPRDEAAGRPAIKALVLELVEGATLADVIEKSGRLPVDEGLGIARQIADALESAHAQGIIHRDLKPSNVKVRGDGTVKVLDFGLAKSMGSDEGSSPLLSASPTITSPAALTGMGVLIGTAAYMSPEQARGKTVDKRADIWAFGCVLYEMLTGRRAFEGEDVSLTLAEVMKSEPAWDALPADVPPRIRTVLGGCLQKDPRQRIRDIGDVRLALEGAFDVPAVAVTTPPLTAAPMWRRVAPWIAGPVAGAAIATALLSGPGAPAGSRPTGRFSILLPTGLQLIADPPAVSPNGETIVFAARRDNVQHLYRRDRGQTDVVRIDGTEGGYYPEFSPDGESLAFTIGGGVIKRVFLAGGTPVTLVGTAGAGPNMSWIADRLLFGRRAAAGQGLWELRASGGEPHEVTTIDLSRQETAHAFPQWLPGGDAVLFTVVHARPNEPNGNEEVAVQRLSTSERRILTPGGYARFVAPGHIVFVREDNLWAAPFDRDRLELTGEPRPLNRQVPRGPGGSPAFAVSHDGMLVMAPGVGLPLRTLVWVGRGGGEEPINVPPRAYTYARLSPDGTRIALDARDGEADIWIWDLARETLLRLTSDPGPNRGPLWSSDSRRVAYQATRDGVNGLFWQPADSSGTPEKLFADGTQMMPLAFTGDGTKLLFETPGGAPYDIGVLTLGADPHVETLFGGSYNEANAALSPDGRWLAYESNESGQSQIYVRPYPNVGASRDQVSTEGGTRPLWSRDGRELLYYMAPNRIMAVSVKGGERLELGRPALAAEGTYAFPNNTGVHYDLSLDGRRLLLLKDVAAAMETQRLEVILDFNEELRRLAPPQ